MSLRKSEHEGQTVVAAILLFAGLSWVAALSVLTGCTQKTTPTKMHGGPVHIDLAEAAMEAESPQYKALSDQKRVGVIAQWAAKRGGYEKSDLLLLRPIANRGNAEAQYVLGMIYRFPSWRTAESGIEQDPAMAHAWFLKAAEQGHSLAAVQVAEDFFRGDGAAKDLDEALRWFEVAANTNHAYAQRMAGSLYLNRALKSGSKQDVSKGMEWLKKAADNGDEEAKRFMSGRK